MTSVSSTQKLKMFIEEATKIMEEAKFDLRGWEFSGQKENTDTLSSTPLLGLLWNTEEDSLSINPVCLKGKEEFADQRINRRIMLSFAQRVFDPIGFTSPTTLIPKLLLQKTWKEK